MKTENKGGHRKQIWFLCLMAFVLSLAAAFVVIGLDDAEDSSADGAITGGTWTYNSGSKTLELTATESGNVLDAYSASTAPWSASVSEIQHIIVTEFRGSNDSFDLSSYPAVVSIQGSILQSNSGVYEEIGTWTFTKSDGLLLINAAIAGRSLPDFASKNDASWAYCKTVFSSTTCVEINQFVSIGNNNLYNFDNTLEYVKANDVSSVKTTTVFKGLKVTSIELKSLNTIDTNDVFRTCTAKTINLGSGNINLNGKTYTFAECANLESITATFTQLGDYSFWKCGKLKDISLADETQPRNTQLSLTSIGQYAFGSCTSLEEFNAPIAKTVNAQSFNSCNSIKKATLGVTTWSTYFKGYTSITTVVMTGATTIEANALNGCSALTTVCSGFDDEGQPIPCLLQTINDSSFAKCLGLVELNMPNTTSVNVNAFTGCTNIKKATLNVASLTACFKGSKSLQELILPSVTNIAEQALRDCSNLKMVTDGSDAAAGLPEGSLYLPQLKTVVNRSFLGCSLITSIYLPAVTTIGYGAFIDCAALETVVLGDLTSIDGDWTTSEITGTSEVWGAFNRTALKTFTANSIGTLGGRSFRDVTSLTEFNCNSVKTVNSYAFSGCSGLTTLNCGSFETINSYCFQNCTSLVNGTSDGVIVLGSSLKSIAGYGFYGCSAIKAVVSNSPVFISVGERCFVQCTSLESVSWEKVQTFGSGCFIGCTSLRSIDCPSLINTGDYTYINYNGTTDYYGAFYNCPLESVKLPSLQIIGNRAFRYCSTIISMEAMPYVTSIGEYAFQNVNQQTEFVFSTQLVTISSYAFYGCTAMTNNTNGNEFVCGAIKTIGTGSFRDCVNLQKFKCGTSGSVTTINELAFYNCTKLETFTCDGSIANIGRDSFYTTALTTFTGDQTVEIGYRAFYYCKSLQSVNFGRCLKNIQYNTFENCENLVDFNWMGSDEDEIQLMTLGDSVFYNCFKLKKFNAGNNTTTIGSSTFYHCDVMEEFITGAVTTVGNSTFRYCAALTSITLPTCISVGQYVFMNCTSLETINIPNATSVGYQMCREIPELKTVNLHSCTNFGEQAFYNCPKLETLDCTSAVTFNNYVCYNCIKLKSIYCPNVNSIGYQCFYNCTDLVSADCTNVVTIGEQAFRYCAALTSIITTKVETVNSYAFEKAGITRIVTGGKLLLIGTQAFDNCEKLEYVGTEAVNSLGSYAFRNCVSLSIGYDSENPMTFNDLSTVNSYTFQGSSINYIKFVKATSVGECALDACKQLTRVEFGNVAGVTLGNYSFRGCSNLMIGTEFSDNVTYIGNAAFYNDTKLTTALFPRVTYLGWGAFTNCTNLDDIMFPKLTVIQDYYNGTYTGTFQGTKVQYIQPGDFDELQTIGSYAFSQVQGLKSVCFPKVTEVRSYAFYRCNGITSTVMESGDLCFPSVNTVRSYAFYNCSSLDTLEFPELVTAESYAFCGCSSTHVIDKDSMPNLTTVGNYTFQSCGGIETLVLNGLTTMGEYAFSSCPNLTSVTMPRLQSIAYRGFYNCGALKVITESSFPSVKSTGERPFESCGALQSVTMNGLETAGRYFFYSSGQIDYICMNSLKTALSNGGSVNESMFYNSSPVEIHFGGMEVLETNAVKGYTKITTLDIPTVKTIQANALDGCTALKELKADTVSSIGKSAFNNCSNLTTLVLPNVETLSDGAFTGCKSKYITIGGMTKVPDEMSNCGVNLLQVTFTDATEISEDAFISCTQLYKISFPAMETVPVLAGYFYNSGSVITEVVFDSATKIQAGAFGNFVKLSKLSFPALVDSSQIGQGAFSGCNALVDIEAGSFPNLLTVPRNMFCTSDTGAKYIKTVTFESATAIDNYAFKNFTLLTTVNTPNVSSIGTGAFDGCRAYVKAVFPGVIELKAGFENNAYISSIDFPNMTKISNNVFSGCKALSEISCPKLETISDGAFKGCIQLTEIGADDFEVATAIKSKAFSGCTGLTTINFPAVETIAADAFENCPLTNVTLGAIETVTNFLNGISTLTTINFGNAKTVEADAFTNCTSLYTVTMDNLLKIEGNEAEHYGAFSGCTSLEAVAFPSVTEIGAYAFANCTSVSRVSLPTLAQYVGALGSYAFSGCTGLTTVSADVLRYIPDYVFENCVMLSDVSFAQVDTIGNGSFENCKAFVDTTISKFTNVSSIGMNAFRGCSGIETVNFTKIETIPAGAFADCTSLKNMTFSKVTAISDGNTESGVANGAFARCTGLTAITVTSFPLLNTIGANAFNGCTRLSSLEFTASTGTYAGVLSVGDYAFYGCIGLIEITAAGLPNAETIGNSCFENCNKLLHITLPAAVSIGDFAFGSDRELLSMSASNVRNIGNSAFYLCSSIPSIELPSLGKPDDDGNPASVGTNVFESCMELSTVSLPYMSYVSDYMFLNCIALNSITVGGATHNDKVIMFDTIGRGSFKGCTNGLVSVKFDYVTVTGDFAFENCSNLSSVDMGLLKDIGLYTFAGCPSLTSVSFKSVETIPKHVFSNYSEIGSTLVDQGNKTMTSVEFADAEVISEDAFRDFVALENISFTAVKEIGANAFFGCSKIKSVSFPNMMDVPNGVFSFLTSLETVRFVKALTIQPAAFQGCSKLSTIQFDSVTDIGDDAFLDCPALKTVSFPKLALVTNKYFTGTTGIVTATFSEAVSVEADAFKDCTTLKSITINSALTALSGAFSGCTSLDTVNAPKLKTISEHLFEGCTSLKDLNFPAAESIEAYAFKGCKSLVTIPGTSFPAVTKIGSNESNGAFLNCESLTTVEIPNVTSILNNDNTKEGAFEGCLLLTEATFAKLDTLGIRTFKGCLLLDSIDGTHVPELRYVGEMAFYGCSGITKVTLMKAETIGISAFEGCTSIQTISENDLKEVISIGERGFYGCSSLASVTFPALRQIGIESFAYCLTLNTLTDKSMPAVTEITARAFANCNQLRSLTFTAVTKLDASAFQNCPAIDNVKFTSLKTVNTAFRGMTSLQTIEFTIAETLNDECFMGCTKLLTVSLPNVKTIGVRAFSGCLTIINLEMTSVETIGEDSFNGCTAMKTVSMINALTIGNKSFYGCNQLTNMTFTKATRIGEMAFYGCSAMQSIDDTSFPSVKNVSTSAFARCTKLTTASFPAMETIPANMFNEVSGGGSTLGNNTIISLTFAKGITVSENAFEDYTELQTIHLKQTKTTGESDGTICSYAFKGCTSLNTIGDDFFPIVNKVENYAFAGCTDLTEVSFPGIITVTANMFNDVGVGNNVLTTVHFSKATAISSNAFYNYTKLSVVDCPLVNTFGSNPFEGCTSYKDVSFPGVTIVSNVFKGNTNIVSASFENATQIQAQAFMDCTGLQTISFPKVKSVVNNAFQNCTGLTDVSFESMEVVDTIFQGNAHLQTARFDGALEVRDNAFAGCTGLTYVSMKNVKTVGTSVFSDCTRLTTILMDKLERFGIKMFYNCTGLTEITDANFPTVTDAGYDYGNSVFMGCSNLEKVTLSSLKNIYGESMFEDCLQLRTVSFPELSNVGMRMFYNCTALPAITEGTFDNVGTIETQAFYNCSGLKQVSFRGATEIGDEAFRKSGIASIDGNTGFPNVITIGSSAFRDCSSLGLTTEPVFKKAEAIGSFAFCSTSIKSVSEGSFPAAKSLGTGAFASCSNLTKVYFESVDVVTAGIFNSTVNDDVPRPGNSRITDITYVTATSIESYAFQSFTALKTIKFDAVASIGTGAFTSCSSLTTVSFPGVIGEVPNVFRDNTTITSVAFNNATSISDNAFSGCTKLSTISFTSAETIGRYAFQDCQLITRIGADTFAQVTSIGEGAFAGCKGLAGIQFDEAKTIGANAFQNCTMLKEISEEALPKVESISSGTFAGCVNLTIIHLPKLQSVGTIFQSNTYIVEIHFDNVNTIVDRAFMRCTALKIASFKNATSIGMEAFTSCAQLNNVTFTKVTSIGDSAFRGCTSLTTASFPGITGSIPTIFSGNGIFQSLSFENATSVAASAFVNCSALRSFKAPKVTTAGTGVFTGCSRLTDVDLASLNSVTTSMFENCSSLKNISLPAAISIKANAFSGCTSLETIKSTDMPNVTSVGDVSNSTNSIFKGCVNIKEVSLQKVKDVYGPSMFAGCELLTMIDMPAAQNIGKDMFKGCSTLATISNTNFKAVTEIGESAFEGCIKLSTVNFPSAQKISDNAFKSCESLRKITSANFQNVKTIGQYAFSNCGLDDVYFPAATAIDIYAFENCKFINIASKAFPELTIVSEYMFASCSALNTVEMERVTSIDATSFDGCSSLISVSFPGVTSVSTMFQEKMSLTTVSFSGATEIEDGAFSGCSNLVNISFDSVERIGNKAFNGCTALRSLVNDGSPVFGSATSIGDQAFNGCYGITEISFPSVTSVGASAFSGCTGLTKLTEDEFGSLLTIGERAFNGCTNISIIVLPKVTTIGDRAFAGCKIVSIEFPELLEITTVFSSNTYLKSAKFRKATIIDTEAFKGCTALNTTEFPAVTTVGDRVFANCQNLKTLIFPSVETVTTVFSNNQYVEKVQFDNATAIMEDAFSYCSNLKEVEFPKVTTLSNAFTGCNNLVTVSFPSVVKVPTGVFTGSEQLKSATFSSATSVEKNAFNKCVSLSSIMIPKVTNIGASAFKGCTSLKSVNSVDPDTGAMLQEVKIVAEMIGESAFEGSGITYVTVSLPAGSIASLVIGNKAFYNCSTLKYVDLGVEMITTDSEILSACPAIETLILDSATTFAYDFSGHSNITTVQLQSLSSFGGSEALFKGCTSLTTVKLKDKVDAGTAIFIEKETFYGCIALNSINFTNVSGCGESAFEGCTSLKSVQFNTVADGSRMGPYAFKDCTTLSTVDLGSMAISGKGMFYGCISLKTLMMNKTNEIANETFYGCTSLAKVTNTSVTKIDEYAFSKCVSLDSVSMTSVGTVGNHAFDGCSKLANFELNKDDITLNITIGQYAFLECGMLSNINFDRVKTLQDYAFSNCNGFRNIDLKAVTDVSDYAFQYCSNLDTIKMDEVKYLGVNVFSGCNSLANVSMDGIEEIQNPVFSKCTTLVTVSMNSIKTIGTETFSGCSALITIGDEDGIAKMPNVRTIGPKAFDGCTRISEIRFGPYLTDIGESAFNNCASLREIVLPNSVKTVGQSAFSSQVLSHISLPSSITSIGKAAFTTSYATGLNLYINFAPNVISGKTGLFHVDTTNTQFKMNIYIGADYEVEEYDLTKCVTYDTKKGTTVQNYANVADVEFTLRDTTSGHTLTYDRITAIDGSKIVLPYEEEDEKGVSPVSTYFGAFFSDTSEMGLGIIVSDQAYDETGEFAKSCDVITMHVASNDMEMFFIGDQDGGDDGYFQYELTILTTEGVNVDIYEQNELHYGSQVRIPKPTDEGVKLTDMIIAPGSYRINFNAEYFLLGSYIELITPVTGNVTFKITYVDNETSNEIEQNYNDPIILPEFDGIEGYDADGWYTKPNGQGEKMTTTSKVTRSMTLYAYYIPSEFVITITSDVETAEDVVVTMYGLYTLYIEKNTLYYTDVKVTEKKIIYNPDVRMPGYTVDAYCKPGSRVEPMNDSPGGNGPYIGTNFIYILVTPIDYSMTFRFYSGNDEIGTTVYISGLIHGHETGDYVTGDVINGFTYSELKLGVSIPLPMTDNCGFSGIGVYNIIDGEEQFVKTIQPGSDGSSIIRSTEYRNGTTNVLLKFSFIENAYRIRYVYHDDNDTIAWNSELLNYIPEQGTGDEFVITSASFYTNVGYTFSTWYIGSEKEGTYVEYTLGRHALDPQMIEVSEMNIITFEAKWIRIDYTVEFNTNGSDTQIEPFLNIVIGEEMDITDTYNIELKGYTLEGWQWYLNDLICSEPFTDTIIMLDKDIIADYEHKGTVTLRACWIKNGYTIKADTETYGGKFDDIKNVQVGDTFTIWSQGYALNDYHTFEGWYAIDDPERTVYSDQVTIDQKLSAIGDANDGIIIFRMQWKSIDYYIYFDSQDTGSSMLYGPYHYGDPFERPDGSTLVNEGYEFMGWSYIVNDISEYKTEVFDSVLAHYADDIEHKVSMYPVWLKKTYSIEYELNGGVSGASNPNTANYGDTVTISNPVRVGYKFLGWTATNLTTGAVYVNASGDRVAWDGTVPVNDTKFMNLNSSKGTVLLKANWDHASYGTIFDANGGVGETTQGSSVKLGEQIELPDLDDYSMIGYTASGWSYDRVNVMTSDIFDSSMAAMANEYGSVTFYVIWAPTMYTVTIMYTDALSESRQVLYDSTLTLSDPSSMNIGYTFNGWEGSGISDEASYSYNGDTWQHWDGSVVQAFYFKNLSSDGASSGLVMTAKWTTNEYHIIYDANGGTGAPTDSRTYSIGMKISEASTSGMTNGNKTFKGWSLTSDSTSTTNVTTFDRTFASAAESGAVTFYAVWIESEFKTVIIDLKGSTPDHIPDGWEYNPETQTYSKEFSKNADKSTYMADWNDVVLSQSGKVFTSWSTSTSGDNVTVVANYDTVDVSKMYIFVGAFVAAIVGILIFIRIER